MADNSTRATQPRIIVELNPDGPTAQEPRLPNSFYGIDGGLRVQAAQHLDGTVEYVVEYDASVHTDIVIEAVREPVRHLNVVEGEDDRLDRPDRGGRR